MKKSGETKTVGVRLVFSWIFSIIFIVGGIGGLVSSFFAGVLLLLAGVIILPPFNHFLEEKHKLKITPWLKIVIVLALLVFSGMVLQTNDSNVPQSDNPNTQDTLDTGHQEESLDTQTTPPPEETDSATIGEKNALSQAKSYLNYMPFSYSGLIEQLEFEGYSNSEATYGADNCGADWNEQAALAAESYLDLMPFSREGLIEQLEFEGFTTEQAEYGVEAVGY